MNSKQKPKIICVTRKEKGCKEKQDTCIWKNDKCFYKEGKQEQKELKELKELKNRHCIFYTKTKTATKKMEDGYTTEVNLKSKFKEPYDNKYKNVTNVHLGQRKLLLSEIQMLLEFYKKDPNNSKNPILIYIGSAPGTHLLHLSVMFPKVKFILYDGAKFDTKLKDYPDVFEIHEGEDGFFTNEKCKLLKKRLTKENKENAILFVSDIRLEEKDSIKFENNIFRDMNLQQEWVKIIKPDIALLKFRMSYNMKSGDKLKYLKGKLLYGVWPKSLSGETRLLVLKKDISKSINYDFKNYEENLFFHNKYIRPFCFPIPSIFKKYISSHNNIYCPCYDCITELNILYEYSKLFKVSFNTTIKKYGSAINHMHKNNFFKENQPLKAIDNKINQL
jgi:hypothetical protein